MRPYVAVACCSAWLRSVRSRPGNDRLSRRERGAITTDSVGGRPWASRCSRLLLGWMRGVRSGPEGERMTYCAWDGRLTPRTRIWWAARSVGRAQRRPRDVPCARASRRARRKSAGKKKPAPDTRDNPARVLRPKAARAVLHMRVAYEVLPLAHYLRREWSPNNLVVGRARTQRDGRWS